MQAERLAAISFSTGYSDKGHAIIFARHVAQGPDMGMHRNVIIFPGP